MNACAETGEGPGVVCLHANASGPAQWRDLTARLAPRHRVLAPEAPGRASALRDEAARLQPVFARAGDPFVLVGHSYGGALALVAALQLRGRVRALVLYEPTLFALVDAACAPPNEADGIRAVVAHSAAALAAGRRDRAAEAFIDYWSGAGAWQAMPAPRRAAVESAIVNAPCWAEALFGEPTPLAAFGALAMPVLLMTGRDSPPSARAVARLLATTLPNVEVRAFEGAGHMGPLTHAAPVNDAIEDFLHRHPP